MNCIYGRRREKLVSKISLKRGFRAGRAYKSVLQSDRPAFVCNVFVNPQKFQFSYSMCSYIITQGIEEGTEWAVEDDELKDREVWSNVARFSVQQGGWEGLYIQPTGHI